MKTVLRQHLTGEITHVHYTTQGGVHYYLTPEARDKMYDFDEKQLNDYYSGEDHIEVESLKEDLLDIMLGVYPKEYTMMCIARTNGLISLQDIIEIKGE